MRLFLCTSVCSMRPRPLSRPRGTGSGPRLFSVAPSAFPASEGAILEVQGFDLGDTVAVFVDEQLMPMYGYSYSSLVLVVEANALPVGPPRHDLVVTDGAGRNATLVGAIMAQGPLYSTPVLVGELWEAAVP